MVTFDWQARRDRLEMMGNVESTANNKQQPEKPATIQTTAPAPATTANNDSQKVTKVWSESGFSFEPLEMLDLYLITDNITA